MNCTTCGAAAAPLRPVAPVRPVAAYIGGKRNLAKRLVARIDATPHSLYAEPFVGMGGVFFRRTKQPAAEIINDVSRDVTNLFRILQRHYVPFVDMLKWMFAGRSEFERLMAVDPDTCTDLERAARFLYLQRNAFGGKVAGRTFGVSYGSASRFQLSQLEPMLQAVHDRLERVTIERLGYEAFIAKCDRPGALFFLDPPYFGNEGDYGAGVFDRADFERLAEQLAGLSGRFILTINATPETRAIFGRFDVDEADVTWSLAGHCGTAKKARELIVSGGN